MSTGTWAPRSLPSSRAWASRRAAYRATSCSSSQARTDLRVAPSRHTALAQLPLCASGFSDLSTGRPAPPASVRVFDLSITKKWEHLELLSGCCPQWRTRPWLKLLIRSSPHHHLTHSSDQWPLPPGIWLSRGDRKLKQTSRTWERRRAESARNSPKIGAQRTESELQGLLVLLLGDVLLENNEVHGQTPVPQHPRARAARRATGPFPSTVLAHAPQRATRPGPVLAGAGSPLQQKTAGSLQGTAKAPTARLSRENSQCEHVAGGALLIPGHNARAKGRNSAFLSSILSALKSDLSFPDISQSSLKSQL